MGKHGDYHKKCDEEKLIEVRDKHDDHRKKDVCAKCRKKCKKICVIECEQETMNIDTWGFTEVYDLQDEHYKPDKPDCDKHKRY